MFKKKMKVLYLTNIPSPYRVNFFNELGRHCDLTVLFERSASDERDSSWHNVNFTDFNAIFLKGVKKGPNKAFCPEVVKYLSLHLFDIIIVGGYATPTGMLAIHYLKIKKIPFLLNTDGGIIKNNESFVKRFIKRYHISSANFWLSTGKETTKYLKHYGANSKNIFVYPFTTILDKDVIDEGQCSNRNKNFYKEKLNITDKKVILTVGQFIHRKGFDVLLKACKNIPTNYGVYIVGGKPTREYLELKEKYGLTNIQFIGFLSKDELKEYYLASDLFVLPTREDIWGLVINEAMAWGLPVITTDKCVAGLELVKNKQNGFIIPINNWNILSERINEILEDNSLRDVMSKNSLEKIKYYTIENMAIKHMEIFDSILKKEKTYEQYFNFN